MALWHFASFPTTCACSTWDLAIPPSLITDRTSSPLPTKPPCLFDLRQNTMLQALLPGPFYRALAAPPTLPRGIKRSAGHRFGSQASHTATPHSGHCHCRSPGLHHYRHATPHAGLCWYTHSRYTHVANNCHLPHGAAPLLSPSHTTHLHLQTWTQGMRRAICTAGLTTTPLPGCARCATHHACRHLWAERPSLTAAERGRLFFFRLLLYAPRYLRIAPRLHLCRRASTRAPTAASLMRIAPLRPTRHVYHWFAWLVLSIPAGPAPRPHPTTLTPRLWATTIQFPTRPLHATFSWDRRHIPRPIPTGGGRTRCAPVGSPFAALPCVPPPSTFCSAVPRTRTTCLQDSHCMAYITACLSRSALTAVAAAHRTRTCARAFRLCPPAAQRRACVLPRHLATTNTCCYCHLRRPHPHASV